MSHRSRPFRALALAALAPALIGAGGADGDVTVTVTKLRSAKGQILACLTSDPHAFPDCQRDSAARALILPAREGMVLNFGRVPEGRYAIALIHDENGNGKLDKHLVIPREGFGFSRNAPVASPTNASKILKPGRRVGRTPQLKTRAAIDAVWPGRREAISRSRLRSS